MTASLSHASQQENQSFDPSVHLSYECITHERVREAAFSCYEIAFSITYPVETGHFSLKVTGRKRIKMVLHERSHLRAMELVLPAPLNCWRGRSWR